MKEGQTSKLLLEQRNYEEGNLNVADIEAYQHLFDLLETEKKAIRQEPSKTSIAADTMARIILLQEQQDKRRDAVHLSLGIALGVLAVAIAYFYVDRPLLQIAFAWVKQHLHVITFTVVIIFLIQLADSKLVRRPR